MLLFLYFGSELYQLSASSIVKLKVRCALHHALKLGNYILMYHMRLNLHLVAEQGPQCNGLVYQQTPNG